MEPAKALVERMVGAYNRKDLQGVMGCYGPDPEFVDPFHPRGVRGRREVGRILRGLFATLPDEQMELTGLVADGPTVVAEFESRGTVAAGGGEGARRPFTLRLAEVYQLEGEHIQRCVVYVDTVKLAEVGLLPTGGG